MSSRRGFTLIELLVVIAIIALLASIILVSVSAARQQAVLAKAKEFDASTYHFLGDTIVGEWDFGECSGTLVHDISGFGNNGTLVGSPAWSTDTPTGQGCSLSFNGSTSYVTIPSTSLVNTDTLTVCAWAKPSSFPGFTNIVSKAENTGYEQFGLGVDGSGNIYFQLGSSPTAQGVLTLNQWQFICGTATASGSSLYINGQDVGTVTGNNSVYNPSYPIRIGNSDLKWPPVLGPVD